MKKCHQTSNEGLNTAKHHKVIEATKEDNMFPAGMNAALASRTAPPNLHQASITHHYKLSHDTVDLTVSARFYVYWAAAYFKGNV